MFDPGIHLDIPTGNIEDEKEREDGASRPARPPTGSGRGPRLSIANWRAGRRTSPVESSAT
ncbi:MAG: hypothetical protein OXC19_18205 [Bryobacterales bacterium]|nr:hypothetical protein [Bryobacterales bacterium]